jgi:ribosomal protein L11 methyltransferase
MRWTVQSPESWKLTAPISRAQADRLTGHIPDFDLIDEPPVLVVSEPDPKHPDDWQFDVYFQGHPDESLLGRVRAFTGVEGGVLERLEDADWVTISQAWLEPIRAGRFYIHTAAHADAIPADAIAFLIEASRAFGTGHHETTAGCLAALSDLAVAGRDFARIADIGTGTGLLAFAARALWPDAAVVATDIDPVAIPVVAENMAANGIAADAITLAVADGTDHPVLRGAPFDLVTANILAGPLIALAPDFARLVAPGGTILLAGLLTSQEADVRAAFAAVGFAGLARRLNGDWSILALTRGDGGGAEQRS